MTRKERMSREIGLAFDLLQFFIENPDEMDSIPDGAYVDFIGEGHTPIAIPPEPDKLVLFEVTRKFRRVNHAA